MKTLLQGGPKDGQVIETKRYNFGIGYISETRQHGELISSESHYYKDAHEPIKHPCKKRGKVRVFEYCGDKCPWEEASDGND